MTEVELLLGDCRERMRELADDSIDACVTDPPYELGFMGKSWDAAGVSFQPETWAEVLRVLKPGGHLLAFGGTRTSHRIAVAIEDAGFEIRDTLAWMYGSGFPKSLDVSKELDRAAGVEREDKFEGSFTRFAGPTGNRKCDDCGKWLVSGDPCRCPRPQDEPMSDDAKRWRGWGTALKPAYEPIIVARKPLAGTVVANVLEHGTGAMNVDACRVGFASPEDEAESKEKNRHGDFGTEQGGNEVYGDYSMLAPRENYDPPGRWPPNVILSHTDGCVLVGEREVKGDGNWSGSTESVGYEGGWDTSDHPRDRRVPAVETVPVWACVPECPVRILDDQTGELKSGRLLTHHRRGGAAPIGTFAIRDRTGEECDFGGDSGGASRFFYCAKTSRVERNAGLDASFEERMLRWSSGEESPGTFQSEGTEKSARNHHPTVKPIDVMRWLIRLVTPPGGVVLDPFLGSGSTGCAAMLESAVGRFVGVERESDYLDIARARIAFWQEHGEDALEVVRMRSQSEERRREIADAGQLDLLSEHPAP